MPVVDVIGTKLTIASNASDPRTIRCARPLSRMPAARESSDAEHLQPPSSVTRITLCPKIKADTHKDARYAGNIS
jgi:hypothetical protein